MHSIGLWGNLLFVLVFIIIGFPFTIGYIPLAVGGGYLYGMLEGTLTISIAASTSAAVAFWVCRTLSAEWIKSMVTSNPKWTLFMKHVEQNAWKICIVTRLLPFPFGLTNALFAVCISFVSLVAPSKQYTLIGIFSIISSFLNWIFFGFTAISVDVDIFWINFT